MKNSLVITACLYMRQENKFRFAPDRGIVAGEFLRDQSGHWWTPVRHTSIRDGDMIVHVSDTPIFDGFSLEYTGEEAIRLDRLAGVNI